MPLATKRLLAYAAPLAVFLGSVGADVVREPLQTGVTFDLGQVPEASRTLDKGMWIQRTGVSVTQAIDVQDRLRIVVGIGGLFFNSYPEDQNYRRSLKFGPGVGQAQGILKLGSSDNPWGNLSFGLIPYKYNPDAKNLGEYLLRSGAYPNVLITGGFSILNSANIMIQGVGLRANTGPLTHDFLITMERGWEPTGDITPAYVVSYKPVAGLELGGGAAYAHLIPIKPSKTTPTAKVTTIEDASSRYKNDTVVTDPSDPGGSKYTFKAIKVMARASLNFQSWIRSDWLGPEDLKLYSEAAVLGWKNYPFYYSDRWHRIPVMVGFNIPTLKLLDVLSLEVEYRKADFANSVAQSYVYRTIPLPDLENGVNQSPVGFDKNALSSGSWYRNEGIKWSVYAKRQVVPGLDLFAQVASDHNRLMTFTSDGALVPAQDILTRKPSDWYYMLRLQLGI